MLRIAHLVDDTGPGGVTRYLDFIARDPAMQAFAHHQIIPVPRNSPAARPIRADVIVSHLAITWRGLPGLLRLRARNAGTPLVHVEHSYSAGFVTHNVTARRRFHTLLRCAYALFDSVVAVSEAQGAWLVARGLVNARALCVIRPCVDLSAFRAVPALSGQLRNFGLIGRLDRQKGFDIAIKAFRSLPDPALRLHVFGSGAERDSLRQAAGRDARIVFHPFVADPAAAMALCDAILMPSRWEPFGIVALEARAAGRVLAVTPVDGLRDHAATASYVCQGSTVTQWAAMLKEMAGTDITIPLRHPADCAAERATRLAWFRLLNSLAVDAKGSAICLAA